MRSVEGEGSTIDDAIARALTALGVARDQAEIDILWNASRGVLGIGRRKARVRATVRARIDLIAATGSTEEGQPAIVTTDSAATVRTEPPSPAERVSGVDGADILREILRRMRLTISVVEAGGETDERVLRLEGADAADAIGRRGEVLDALEYLVNRIAERGGRVRGRFVLDAVGFRERRQAGLEQRAHRLAEKARTRRRPIATNLLSPDDRRAIYLALKLENGIVARSVGQGVYRKLVIIPEGVRRGGGKATQ